MPAVFAMIALLAAGQGLQAPSVPASGDAQASAVARAKPKLICEEDAEIGSRIAKKKICMTREEWRAYRLDNQERLGRTRPLGTLGG